MSTKLSLLKHIKWLPPAQQGSITVTVALLLPIMLLMVALIVDINQLIFSKIRLQNTVDACALSAAAVQAAGLNEIADLNGEMVREYTILSQILKKDIWWDRGQALSACNFFYNGGNGVIDYLRRYQEQSNFDYAMQADIVARHVKELNLPQSKLISKRTGPLTTLNEIRETMDFTYYSEDDPESPPGAMLQWQKPGTPRFADIRDGTISVDDTRVMPLPDLFSMPERVFKASPTYVDYELLLPAGNLLLAGDILGGFPPLRAKATAKPAGGHIQKGRPEYTAVLIR